MAHGNYSATFEQQFGRLQEVVQRLSDGNLTLQEALSAFEEGMSLADRCAQMLDEAELRVKQVSERIWLVTFMHYDLGYFDDETCRLEPIENPFGPKVLPLRSE